MTIQKKTTATSSTNNGVYPKCGDKGGAKWKI
jgi:hypothetical protein